MSQVSTHALDLDAAQWSAWAVENGARAFVGPQIMKWIFERGVTNPELFSNISPALRTKAATEFNWSLPEIDTALTSQDTSQKILLRLKDGLLCECVLMPSENRVTLCVSSQVGCRMGCTFCQTGRMGLTRNLTSGEILAQLMVANQILAKMSDDPRKVTNIVFMGMGEPLDNFDHVVKACKVFIDPSYFGLSKHKVTVSTSGLVPEIKRLGEALPVALAISLHSADDAHRSKMMPVNRQYPLDELKKVLLEYPVQTRHGITFEYVMIKDENDSIAHAKKLVKFLHGLKAKVNLIPMNAHPGNPMEASVEERLRAFQSYLSERSIPAPVRYSRGQDVSAACGQLASKRQAELSLPPRTVALARRREWLAEKNAE